MSATRAKRRKPDPVNVFIKLDPDVRRATDDYIAAHNATGEHRATIKSTVEAALKLFLGGKGFWGTPKV